jgi:hypothetical protein
MIPVQLDDLWITTQQRWCRPNQYIFRNLWDRSAYTGTQNWWNLLQSRKFSPRENSGYVYYNSVLILVSYILCIIIRVIWEHYFQWSHLQLGSCCSRARAERLCWWDQELRDILLVRYNRSHPCCDKLVQMLIKTEKRKKVFIFWISSSQFNSVYSVTNSEYYL